MGYGGIFKSVVKIAVTYVGFQLGGPFGAAVASAAFTGATGGSFKEALVSGATAFIGAKISVGLSDASAAATALEPFGGSGGFVGSVGPDASFSGAIGDVVNSVGASLDPVTDFISDAAASQAIAGPSQFLGDAIFDPLATATSTAFDVFNSVNTNLLGDLLPKFAATSLVEGGAGLVAAGVGGLASLTLEQALNAEIPGLDQALIDEAGFDAAGVSALRNEARNALSQAKFTELTGPDSTLENPFFREGQDADAITAAEEEFKKVIASGIERENVRLGPDITEQQFNTAFEDEFFGQGVLQSEEDLRKQAFGQEVGAAFPGDAFQSLDDDIINSIVSERRGPAEQQISNFSARGNLNPTGGLEANAFINRQIPKAGERVRELGAGVLGQNQQAINDIRDRATEGISNFQLGDDLFDVTPFSDERGTLIGDRIGSLRSDVSTAVGQEPLFDIGGALGAGGRAQGVVSGQGQNQSFLDSIAAREGAAGANRTRRGIGSSRGSGAF